MLKLGSFPIRWFGGFEGLGAFDLEQVGTAAESAACAGDDCAAEGWVAVVPGPEGGELPVC